MKTQMSLARIFILLITVVSLLGCKKENPPPADDPAEEEDYFVRFKANGRLYEHDVKLAAKLSKTVDDDGAVYWEYAIEGGNRDSTKIELDGTIHHQVVEHKKYQNNDEDNGVFMMFGKSGYSALDPDYPAEITFTEWSDEYIRGQFSGMVYEHMIFTSDFEPMGMGATRITDGEFYLPVTIEQ